MNATPDAVPNSWVDRTPANIQPYLRLMRADRPIGTWLLYIPCLWGLAAAAMSGGDANFAWFVLLFAIGAYAMRGAGCVYNDIVDQDFDGLVERTAARPIPAGLVTTKQAWALLTGLCLIGLLVLIQLNQTAIIVALASLFFVGVYPFMKRITWWPQAWLGLTFNWGALVGYAAVASELTALALAIYAAGIFWTLGYDTIYAHQDKDDDALIGVKSTARRFGDNTKPWLIGFYASTIILIVVSGAMTNASAIFYAALLPAAAHFTWQIRTLDIANSHNCLIRFKSNREAGLLLLLAPICEVIFRSV
ncbi:MAG: 4-hydroxybenzoate octaprenyltransferase [Marinicaulis sp.]|nr:4-hydroxybenzoate octaprenyltransferase [Marinicaulis sp.]